MDQLYLIRRTIGDLLPRHLAIFQQNEFFAGIILPTPQTLIPLEIVLPKRGNTILQVNLKFFFLNIFLFIIFLFFFIYYFLFIIII